MREEPLEPGKERGVVQGPARGSLGGTGKERGVVQGPVGGSLGGTGTGTWYGHVHLLNREIPLHHSTTVRGGGNV